MGRKKINIEEIKDERNRQVCFGKRKLGLLKKARELSILCRCEIGIMVFSADGTLHRWNSPQSSMSDLLQRYADATARAGAIDSVKETDERLSEEYTDAEEGEEAEEEPELRQSCKRKRDRREASVQPVRAQKSVSPALRDVSVAPSQLDLRLNAAAQQCSSMTPRSEKALCDISREFDNLFSQFSASESPTPAATQGSPQQVAGCLRLAPAVSSPSAYPSTDPQKQDQAVQQNCDDPDKTAKSPVKISAWSFDAGLDSRSTALPAHSFAHPEPSKPLHPLGMPNRSVELAATSAPSAHFAARTTSAFNTLPVRPIASAAPTARHILDNHPALQHAHVQSHHLGGGPGIGPGMPLPSSSVGGIIRHSSCSAFVPASAANITSGPNSGSLPNLGSLQYMRAVANSQQPRFVPSLPQLQLAVVPVDQIAVASASMIGPQSTMLATAPWALPHPQALRPSTCCTDQIQPLMAAQLLGKAGAMPASYWGPTAFDPVKAEGFNHLLPSAGSVYIPRGADQLPTAAQANLPMRLAMGMS